jgi:hypothetical protein
MGRAPDSHLRLGEYVYCRPAFWRAVPVQKKRFLSELLGQYSQVLAGHVVGMRGPRPRLAGIQMGIEVSGLEQVTFSGLDFVALSPEIQALTATVSQEVRQWIPSLRYYGIVVVNNLDLVLGEGGGARFLSLATCVYRRGGSD